MNKAIETIKKEILSWPYVTVQFHSFVDIEFHLNKREMEHIHNEGFENNFNSKDKDIKKFERIRKRYKRISENHGAEIKETYYITREEKEDSHLYENADFSVDVIKKSIKNG